MAGIIKGKKPCKAEACDIQSCLDRQGFKVQRCLDVILKLKKCCETHDYAPEHCASFVGLIEEALRIVEKQGASSPAFKGQ